MTTYAVVGGGCVGSLVASALHLGGREVTVVEQRSRARYLRQDGVRVLGAWAAQWMPADVREPGDRLPLDTDVVCLAVPSGRTSAALATLPGTTRTVVCFQNGLANERSVARTGRVPRGALVAAAARTEPDGAVRTLRAPRFVLGRWPTGVDDVCAELARDLSRGGVDAQQTRNLQTLKLAKLVGNLGSSVLALTGQDAAAALCDADTRRCLHALMTEAVAVLDAAGIGFELPWSPRALHDLADSLAGPPREPAAPGADAGPVLPSLAVDLTLGRDPEVEARTGEVEHVAATAALRAPVAAAISAALRAGEHGVAPAQLWCRLESARSAAA